MMVDPWRLGCWGFLWGARGGVGVLGGSRWGLGVLGGLGGSRWF